MSTPDKKEVIKETEESRKNATDAAKENTGETIHTVNPFTGTETNITPEDLEGIEKFNEAQTERD